MIAHIRKSDGAVQSLESHCTQVAKICEQTAHPLGLSKAAYLLGLLHDMGKATEKFKEYLFEACHNSETPSPYHHSFAGAIFVYRRWFCDENEDMYRHAAAQIFSLCICGHHAGLMNCLNEHMTSDFLENMKLGEKSRYDESSEWFLKNVVLAEKLDLLFEEAQQEIKKFIKERIRKQKNRKSFEFQLGMLTRLLLSILVDADRWDSACFEYGTDPTAPPCEADWEKLFASFEEFRKRELNSSDEIGKIRSEISDRCAEKAADRGGIYTLCVPTGGGKTFSSLRYALKHAAVYKKKRIFYIIPYNTILDQNAQDIRTALSDYPSILEHHSNVVMPTEEEQESYRRLTERWDSDIVLTSLVQFLDSCFGAPNTDARRLCRLTNAVLIFDEIQSLPKHCKTLFEQAITFLCSCCGSTVILCTATQPKLELTPQPEELMNDCTKLFEKMKRVTYIPQLKTPLYNGKAAEKISVLLSKQSVLTIVNTKAVARGVYHEVVARLPEMGMVPVSATLNSFDEELSPLKKNEVLCVHMSTLLCPTHRKQLIKQIKLRLKQGSRVFCVSTALIEAGINVSFPTVVRSLTGLPSIVQAAGRANRSMEYESGNVYIWEFCDEKLGSLPDIQNGGNIARCIFSEESSAEPDSPEEIGRYFSLEENYTKKTKDYPLGGERPTLYSLISDNDELVRKASDFKENRDLILHQSFRTAYREFEVIAQNTKTVIVPFGSGKELIAQLKSESSMKQLRFLLKAAQAYCVALPESTFKRLCEEKAILGFDDIGVYCLKEGYYDQNSGVTLERGELELMVI